MLAVRLTVRCNFFWRHPYFQFGEIGAWVVFSSNSLKAKIVGFSSKPESYKIPADELLSYHYIEWHLKRFWTLLKHFQQQSYISYFVTTAVSISELWKEHEFNPGLVREPSWQGLDDGEEDFCDGRGVVVKCARPASPDGTLHRGIEAWVNYSLQGRPHAEFKKAQAK